MYSGGVLEKDEISIVLHNSKNSKIMFDSLFAMVVAAFLKFHLGFHPAL